MGGSGEDQALVVLGGLNDDKIYVLGQGYSTELTAGTIDLFIIRYTQDGTLDYMVSFGGSNPDFGVDMKLQGSKIIIIGHSQSSTLSSGFLDIFVAVCDQDTASTTWVRTIGTPSFNEYGYALSVSDDGIIYMMGSISANGFTNGNSDILLAGLKLIGGDTVFVENLGSNIIETPGGLVWDRV